MAYGNAQPPVIVVLLGKPLHQQSVVSGMIEQLHHSFPTISLHHAREHKELPGWLLGSDLIVQRGLSQAVLASAERFEENGVRCCNTIVATRLCGSRLAISERLAFAGVPIPATRGFESWPGVLQIAERQPIVVKRDTTEVGRGAQVLIATDGGELPKLPPFGGPYIVEDFISDGTTVHKLYIVNRKVRGLRKQSQSTGESIISAISFEVEGPLRNLAFQTRDAIGLEIFGMDVLMGRDGPVVVDVNPFPGFRGIDDAARLIANHITSIIRSLDR